VNVLRSIKSWSLGTMTLFSVVLSVVATALLLPKDVEDRTLYTILAKPVPRFDYLAGKLLGVLMLVFVSLALMDLLMVIVLQIRTTLVLQQQVEMGRQLGWGVAEIAKLKAETYAQGPTWSLQAGVAAVFIRSGIIAALALMISTFSTSTLFTTIISFLVYFIGHFQADAREAFFHSAATGQGPLMRGVTLITSLVLPDFSLFNVIDSVIEGQIFPGMLLLKLAALGVFYAILYTISSWFIFAKKEF
ncbi:MAG: ABC transporter permease subunit, partial [Luteolibacter sp.]